MRVFKQKTTLTHKEQLCREICVRIFNEESYSKEFIEGHIENSMPKVLPMISRHERDILGYLAERLLRYAKSCEADLTQFHLPSCEDKLRKMFYELVDGWRDTD